MHRPTRQEILTLLVEARRLIQKGWCKRRPATTSTRQTCPIWHESAVNFCASGACGRAEINLRLPRYAARVAEQVLVPHIIVYENILGPSYKLMAFNDHDSTVKSDVLDLFDRTIRQLQSIPEEEGS